MATPPEEFLCPITLTLMHDPVIGPDGHSYERSAIVQWLRTNPHSPLTRQPMTASSLQTNYSLKTAIERYNSASRAPRRTPRAPAPRPSAPPPQPSAPPGDFAYAVQMQSHEYAQPLLPSAPPFTQVVVVNPTTANPIPFDQRRRRNLLGACACLTVVVILIIILIRFMEGSS